MRATTSRRFTVPTLVAALLLLIAAPLAAAVTYTPYQDATGNGPDLGWVSNAGTFISGSSKYGGGIDTFNETDSGLETNASVDGFGSGDWAAMAAYNLRGTGISSVMANWEDTTNSDFSWRLRIRESQPTGEEYEFQYYSGSINTISFGNHTPGINTLWIKYEAGNLEIALNNVVEVNQTVALNDYPNTELAVGGDNTAQGADNTFDGNFLEARFWNNTVPGHSDLNRISNPDDTYCTQEIHSDQVHHYALEELTDPTTGCTAPAANSPPTASFTRSCTVGTRSCTFNASASTDPDGSSTIITYNWTLGDSTSKQGQEVSHTYAADGTYTVTLTVQDENHTEDSTSQQVTVPPQVDDLAPWSTTSLTTDTPASPRISAPSPNVVWSCRVDPSGSYDVYWRKSEDGGNTWNEQGLSFDAAAQECHADARTQNQVAIVWLDDVTGNATVAVTLDKGSSWTITDTDVSEIDDQPFIMWVDKTSLLLIGEDPGGTSDVTRYATSDDSGGTWSASAILDGSQNAGWDYAAQIHQVPDESQHIRWYTDDNNLACFETADGGQNWSTCDEALPDGDPSGPDIDGDVSWVPVTRDKWVVVGVDVSPNPDVCEAWLTRNAGTSWTKLHQQDAGTECNIIEAFATAEDTYGYAYRRSSDTALRVNYTSDDASTFEDWEIHDYSGDSFTEDADLTTSLSHVVVAWRNSSQNLRYTYNAIPVAGVVNSVALWGNAQGLGVDYSGSPTIYVRDILSTSDNNDQVTRLDQALNLVGGSNICTGTISDWSVESDLTFWVVASPPYIVPGIDFDVIKGYALEDSQTVDGLAITRTAAAPVVSTCKTSKEVVFFGSEQGNAAVFTYDAQASTIKGLNFTDLATGVVEIDALDTYRLVWALTGSGSGAGNWSMATGQDEIMTSQHDGLPSYEDLRDVAVEKRAAATFLACVAGQPSGLICVNSNGGEVVRDDSLTVSDLQIYDKNLYTIEGSRLKGYSIGTGTLTLQLNKSAGSVTDLTTSKDGAYLYGLKTTANGTKVLGWTTDTLELTFESTEIQTTLRNVDADGSNNFLYANDKTTLYQLAAYNYTVSADGDQPVGLNRTLQNPTVDLQDNETGGGANATTNDTTTADPDTLAGSSEVLNDALGLSPGSTGGGLFLTALAIVMVGGGGVMAFGPSGGIVGTIAAFTIGVALDWTPDWYLVVLVAILGTVIVFKLRGNG